MKLWRIRNKKRRVEYKAEYDKKNKWSKAGCDSRYYIKHKAEIRERFRAWYAQNSEGVKNAATIFHKGLSGIYTSIKRGAKKRGIACEISRENFMEWWDRQEKRCFYCGRSMKDIMEDDDDYGKRSHRLTIERIDNNGGYFEENMTLACLRCNRVKSNYFTKDEMLIIGEIIRKKHE